MNKLRKAKSCSETRNGPYYERAKQVTKKEPSLRDGTSCNELLHGPYWERNKG